MLYFFFFLFCSVDFTNEFQPYSDSSRHNEFNNVRLLLLLTPFHSFFWKDEQFK